MTRIRELGFPERVETGQNDRGQATNKQVATSHRSGSSNPDEDRCQPGAKMGDVEERVTTAIDSGNGGAQTIGETIGLIYIVRADTLYEYDTI